MTVADPANIPEPQQGSQQNAGPLAIDLFCGLGGWTEGLLAEGYRVVGFDIEAHEYDGERYPAQLVLQDVLTLHGSQFRDAALIVASPPCQEFSYMAMPWTRAKQIGRALRGQGEFPEGYKGSRTTADLTALFDACFRIQREAIEAAGRHIPLVVENVRGAVPWVGREAWNYGSYYLWGDTPALMPVRFDAYKSKGMNWSNQELRGQDFTRLAGKHCEGRKNPGFRFDGSGKSFQSESVNRHAKPPARVSAEPPGEGRKGAGAKWFDQNISSLPSGSRRRKAASARIAKIPFPLSSWIARTYRPIPLASEAA